MRVYIRPKLLPVVGDDCGWWVHPNLKRAPNGVVVEHSKTFHAYDASALAPVMWKTELRLSLAVVTLQEKRESVARNNAMWYVSVFQILVVVCLFSTTTGRTI